MVKELNLLKNELKLKQLTKVETDIIKLIAHGKSEKEIADIKIRSIHTIKTHLKNIRKKLKLSKNTEIVKFASETGLV